MEFILARHSPPPRRKIEKKTQGGQLSPGKGPPSPGGPQTPPVQALEGNSSAHVSPSAALGLAPAGVVSPRGVPGGHVGGSLASSISPG